MRIDVELLAQAPGYADLVVKRWRTEGEVQQFELAIQRNQDSWYYKGNQEWTSEPMWHRVDKVQQIATNTLRAEVGPWLVDALVEQQGNVQYLVTVRANSQEGKGVVRMGGNLLSSAASGSYTRGSNTRSTTVVATPVEEVSEPIVDKPVVETPKVEVVMTEDVTPELIVEDTLPEEKTKKSNVWLLTLLALLGVVIIAVLAWFLWSDKDTSTSVSATNTSPCTVTAGVNELEFLQACLKTNPNDDALLKLVTEAKEAKSCGIAQRLYTNKAGSHNVKFALAYAKEYDSKFVQVDGCFKEDKEQALYWYKVVLDLDANNQEAKERFEELSKQ